MKELLVGYCFQKVEEELVGCYPRNRKVEEVLGECPYPFQGKEEAEGFPFRKVEHFQEREEEEEFPFQKKQGVQEEYLNLQKLRQKVAQEEH